MKHAAYNVATDETRTADFTQPALSRRAGPVGPRSTKGRYIVLGEQGRGGMGIVSRAFDTRLGRIVALKELVRDTASARVRLEREALLAAGLEHPGIVPIYELDRWPDGSPFFTMKLVRGRSLRALVDEAGTLEQRLGLMPVVLDVCDAMAHAHGGGVIHRDLKPSNIMIDGGGNAVLIDWGLGKRLDGPGLPARVRAASQMSDADTEVGAVLGTPLYMAPEQARSADAVDTRADVFSLGAVLFHIVAGSAPFDGTTVRVRRRQGVRIEPPALAGRCPMAPPSLVAVIERAMAHDAAARFADAGALARALRSAIGERRTQPWRPRRRGEGPPAAGSRGPAGRARAPEGARWA